MLFSQASFKFCCLLDTQHKIRFSFYSFASFSTSPFFTGSSFSITYVNDAIWQVRGMGARVCWLCWRTTAWYVVCHGEWTDLPLSLHWHVWPKRWWSIVGLYLWGEKWTKHRNIKCHSGYCKIAGTHHFDYILVLVLVYQSSKCNWIYQSKGSIASRPNTDINSKESLIFSVPSDHYYC